MDAGLFNFFSFFRFSLFAFRLFLTLNPQSGIPNPNYLNLFCFSRLLSDLKKASLAIARLLFFALHFLINLTGSRLLVYFPPLPD